jgi:uncharacterized membrane protein YsdA (DUF1294 family)
VPAYKKYLVVVFVVFLLSSYYLGYTPIAFSLIVLCSSIFSYLLYVKDKAAARDDAWRVPENTLHLSSLFFGWPGAMIAQERLRHKTKKRRFLFVFWLTVFINTSAIYMLHTPKGAQFIQYSVSSAESLMNRNAKSDDMHNLLLSLIELRN